MNAQKWIARIGVGLTTFAVGVAAGIWASSHFGFTPYVPFAETPPPITIPSVDVQEAAAPSGETKDAASAGVDNPARFRFSPEERLAYKCNTTIRGTGLESIGMSDVAMAFGADINLVTEQVADDGSADLELNWDAVSLQGDFMGSNVNLYEDGQTTIFEMDGKNMLANAEGADPAQGIPQLEFFRTPVKMKVAANGEVTSLSGVQGFGEMLAMTPALSHVQFPGIKLEQGYTWDSDLKLPIPGFGSAADATIKNTVVGFEYLGDRFCAVIQQEYTSRQEDGTLNAPKSALGDAMQFGIPLFDLQGQGLTYFDVNNGQLAHTQLDLKLTLKLSQFLNGLSGSQGDIAKQLGNLLGGQLSGIDELLGGAATPGENDTLLDLSLDINAGMSIVDTP